MLYTVRGSFAGFPLLPLCLRVPHQFGHSSILTLKPLPKFKEDCSLAAQDTYLKPFNLTLYSLLVSFESFNVNSHLLSLILKSMRHIFKEKLFSSLTL